MGSRVGRTNRSGPFAGRKVNSEKARVGESVSGWEGWLEEARVVGHRNKDTIFSQQ